MPRILHLSLALVAACLMAAPSLAGEMTFLTNFAIDKDQTYVCAFGLREGATPAYDGFDLPAPPAPPEVTEDGFLVMVDPPPFMPNRWYRDFRPVDNLFLDRIEFFPMHLVSSRIGEEASISVATGAFNAVPYEMWLIGPGGIYEEVEVPGTINFVITSTQMVFSWELRLDDQISVESRTWSAVKSLYR